MDQVQMIKAESQQILQETEEMIVDLMEKAREEARTILANARDEAEMLLSEAGREAEQMRQQASETGYSQGLQKARDDMAAQQMAAENEAREILENARQQKVSTLANCEADVLRLSLAIARRIVAGELMVNPDFIVNVIREAIALLDQTDNVTVHVNPDDLSQVLQEIGTEIYSEATGSIIKLDVYPDSRIQSGGCTLDSTVGTIDARLETRLESMDQALLEGLQND